MTHGSRRCAIACASARVAKTRRLPLNSFAVQRGHFRHTPKVPIFAQFLSLLFPSSFAATFSPEAASHNLAESRRRRGSMKIIRATVFTCTFLLALGAFAQEATK